MENRSETEKRGERLLDDGVTGQLKQDRTLGVKMVGRYHLGNRPGTHQQTKPPQTTQRATRT